MNALTGVTAGGAVQFLGTTNKAVKTATVDSDPAVLDHAKQFRGEPVLSAA